MTGADLKTFVESLIDDTIEDTLFYTLLNVAKDRLEEDRDWEYLKKIDTDQTSSPDDTYLTMKDLPDDFRRPLGKIMVGLDSEHSPIEYVDRYIYRNGCNKYYIDYANDQFGIIGQPSEQQTIYFPYIRTTNELTSENSPSFPTRFHKILGFDIAGFYTAGVDADDIYQKMSPEHKQAREQLFNVMVEWNTKLALNSMDYSATPHLLDKADNPNTINTDE